MAMRKRVLSAALALVLLLSCVPMTAAATETEEPTITTEATTEAPTEEPAEEPTGAPTEEPTGATVETTEAPAETVEESTEAPTEENAVSTEAPTEETSAPTDAPTEETEAPVEEPTEAAPAETTTPIEATEAPAEESTEAVTEPIETEDATAAQEAVNATTSGSCGENVTWTFDDSTGTLTISGSGEMEDYWYDNPWYSFCTEIKSVAIQDGVTSIGNCAFYECSSLTSIAIPESVTSIGERAFSGCSSLTSITIPDGVTSIGDFSFYNCGSMISVTIPNDVSSIGYSAFSGCCSLTSITIPDGVASIDDYTFYDCSSLTSITIPDSVTSIGDDAFGHCSSLTSIIIPDSVTSIGVAAFIDCSSLIDITIPDSVTSIGGGAFNGCSNLTNIVIPAGVASIGDYAFYGCSSLTDIVIPAGVTSIGGHTFHGCSNLTSVTIPSGVTSIGDSAFYGCYELEEITIPEGVTEIGRNAFYRVGRDAGRDSITIPSSVVTMGEGALDSYYFGKIVFLGDVPEVIGDSDSPELFYNYASLKVFYPAGNTSWTETAKQSLIQGVTDDVIFIAFDPSLATSGSCGANLCWSVDLETKTLTISGTGPMDTWDGVDNFAPWVYYGDEIKTVVIGAGVTSICDGAFQNTSARTLRFSGNAPDIGADIQNGYSEVTAYYPAGDDTWEAVIPRFPNITWVREGSAFASLKDIVAKCDSMTPEEIRTAVQALDRDELLASMRSLEATDDLYNLDSAVQAGYTVIEVSADVPELEVNNSPVYCGATGASLNDLISTDEVVTIRLGRVGTALPIPAGYNGDSAIQFALSMDNVQTPESLKVPVQIAMLIPDSINPFFADVFWRNSETGDVEKLPTYCNWSKAGGMHLSFVITGAGDYCIVPRSNGSVSGVCGDELTWTYDESCTLTISGSGEMYDYGMTSDLAPWSYYRENVNQIAIGEHVTSIGSYAFYDCRFAYKLTIPANVRKIAAGAFSGLFTECIIFEGNAPDVADNSFDSMGAHAYYSGGDSTWDNVITQPEWGGADHLTWVAATGSGTCGETATWAFDEETGALTISGTGAIVDYEYSSQAPWYYIGSKITSVTIQDGITSIGNLAFNNCTSLTSITIPDTVTRIDVGAFNNCSALTSIIIPEGVTSIEHSTFYGCSSLASVTIPSSVTIINGAAFSGCASLTNVTIPSSVTIIDGAAFSGCASLTNVTIPSSVTIIDGAAFYGCASLTSVTIPDSVTSIGDSAFEGCSSLTRITFLGDAPQFLKYEYSEADTPLTFKNVTATAYYPADNTTWTSDVMQNYGGTITWVPDDASDDQTPTDLVPMYRLYNPFSLEHLFTTGAGERDSLSNVGWIYEGIAWNAPMEGTPVHRLYNPYTDGHFYTTSVKEYQGLLKVGWTYDGVVSYGASDANGTPIYRLFNPYEARNYHHYTTSTEEIAMLTRSGWILEGIAWYAA